MEMRASQVIKGALGGGAKKMRGGGKQREERREERDLQTRAGGEVWKPECHTSSYY